MNNPPFIITLPRPIPDLYFPYQFFFSLVQLWLCSSISISRHQALMSLSFTFLLRCRFWSHDLNLSLMNQQEKTHENENMQQYLHIYIPEPIHMFCFEGKLPLRHKDQE